MSQQIFTTKENTVKTSRVSKEPVVKKKKVITIPPYFPKALIVMLVVFGMLFATYIYYDQTPAVFSAEIILHMTKNTQVSQDLLTTDNYHVDQARLDQLKDTLTAPEILEKILQKPEMSMFTGIGISEQEKIKVLQQSIAVKQLDAMQDFVIEISHKDSDFVQFLSQALSQVYEASVLPLLQDEASQTITENQGHDIKTWEQQALLKDLFPGGFEQQKLDRSDLLTKIQQRKDALIFQVQKLESFMMTSKQELPDFLSQYPELDADIKELVKKRLEIQLYETNHEADNLEISRQELLHLEQAFEAHLHRVLHSWTAQQEKLAVLESYLSATDQKIDLKAVEKILIANSKPDFRVQKENMFATLQKENTLFPLNMTGRIEMTQATQLADLTQRQLVFLAVFGFSLLLGWLISRLWYLRFARCSSHLELAYRADVPFFGKITSDKQVIL